jgi:hypothetical protein
MDTVLAEVRLMLGELSRERIHYLSTFLRRSDSASTINSP